MPGTILIIDDSPTELKEIISFLEPAKLFDKYLEAHDGMEGFKTLINEQVELVICDLIMPNMDGIKFLEMVATQEGLRDIPVIMLTAKEDRKSKVLGLDHGACDYVTKPFFAEELIARVKVQLKLKGQQDNLKKSNKILTELTTRDPLTQFHNRRSMMEILEREIDRCKRKDSPLSIAMFDIDHFKLVNDEFGHQAGDSVLISLAESTRSRLRSYDLVARYGGEEFVMILPDTPHEGAILVAERLRTRIEKLEFKGEIANLRVTISLGVASFPSEDVTSVDSLIRAADAALYRAKRGGRNRVESAQNTSSPTNAGFASDKTPPKG